MRYRVEYKGVPFEECDSLDEGRQIITANLKDDELNGYPSEDTDYQIVDNLSGEVIW